AGAVHPRLGVRAVGNAERDLEADRFGSTADGAERAESGWIDTGRAGARPQCAGAGWCRGSRGSVRHRYGPGALRAEVVARTARHRFDLAQSGDVLAVRATRPVNGNAGARLGHTDTVTTRWQATTLWRVCH